MPHASQSDAQAAADRMNSKSDGEPTTAYHCPICLRWHIGRHDKGHVTIMAPWLGPAFRKRKISKREYF